MIARVKVYAPDGVTARTANVGAGAGILPTVGLAFSVERGGGGGCTFTALADDLDDLTARDSVIRVELQASPGQWTAVAAYTLRPPFRRQRVGKQQVECVATALLEQWASETVMLPEYSVGDIPRGAGTDRGIGWMSSAYDPDADPAEPWSGCYNTSRTTTPVEWPTGTNAKWISITGASDESERKLFRTSSAHPLTISTAGPIRVHVASDSPGRFYIAGEVVLDIQGGEPGKEPPTFEQADMFMQPGSYACAFDTASIWDSGGDGVDPMIAAICSLDANGDPDTWLLVTNSTNYVACRRDEDPPDNEPPGPTPGATLGYLVGEAQERAATGWANVTLGFSSTLDSYGTAWTTSVIERQVRYGADTYWSLFQMLAETDPAEADVWMSPAMVLHAAPTQGQTRAITLTTSTIVTMSDQSAADEGTWVAALAIDGWITSSQVGATSRREYGMEIGTALSRAVAARIVDGALAENGRWDGSCRLAPSAPTPLVDFQPGDTIGLSYADAPTSVQVLSMSATAGEGGLLWDLELVEVPS
jgi:hypothetical protein